MNQWLRRSRGAIGMSIVLIAERFVGFDSSVVDIWLPVFAFP